MSKKSVMLMHAAKTKRTISPFFFLSCQLTYLVVYLMPSFICSAVSRTFIWYLMGVFFSFMSILLTHRKRLNSLPVCFLFLLRQPKMLKRKERAATVQEITDRKARSHGFCHTCCNATMKSH